MYLDPKDPRTEHKRVILHFRNIRLYINAGMAIPECRAYAKLLDTDSGRLEYAALSPVRLVGGTK